MLLHVMLSWSYGGNSGDDETGANDLLRNGNTDLL